MRLPDVLGIAIDLSRQALTYACPRWLAERWARCWRSTSVAALRLGAWTSATLLVLVFWCLLGLVDGRDLPGVDRPDRLYYGLYALLHEGDSLWGQALQLRVEAGLVGLSATLALDGEADGAVLIIAYLKLEMAPVSRHSLPVMAMSMLIDSL